MLFNSLEFFFLFLPVTLGGFFLLARWRHAWALHALSLASLFFYGWWNPLHLPLLLGSILFNLLLGRRIIAAHEKGGRPQGWFWFGVTGNLLLLAFFKYARFLLEAGGAAIPPWMAEIALPLGISFFTFTQIAYLADARAGKVVDRDPARYLLFVTFFPHLIAGPILHHGEMMPQFARPEIFRPRLNWLAMGLGLFAIGLCKKVVLADGIAVSADALFNGVAAGRIPTAPEAWLGAFAYGFQIYFDFSGYSDMAIGLSRLFGVRLPLNFDSPYKSTDIVEFWRRWHMTLSRFLRDYLYFPLGGSRSGRGAVNLMITMLLGGLWHGAGWTFLLWGGLHGVYLAVAHAWRRLNGPGPQPSWRRPLGVAVTFLAVTVSWVLFRSPDLETARVLLFAMAGGHGWAWPANAGGRLEELLPLFVLVWFAPNSQQIMILFRPALGRVARPARRWLWLLWRPHALWAAAGGGMVAWAFFGTSNVSRFLYFNF